MVKAYFKSLFLLIMYFLFRVFLSEDGSLKIYNVTRSDAGSYTCVATNQFGVAKNTGSLVVKGILLFSFVLDEHWRYVYLSQPLSLCETCIMLYMWNIWFHNLFKNCVPIFINSMFALPVGYYSRCEYFSSWNAVSG